MYLTKSYIMSHMDNIFNWLFGPITPVTNEFMNVPYPMLITPDLDSLIDES